MSTRRPVGPGGTGVGSGVGTGVGPGVGPGPGWPIVSKTFLRTGLSSSMNESTSVHVPDLLVGTDKIGSPLPQTAYTRTGISGTVTHASWSLFSRPVIVTSA